MNGGVAGGFRDSPGRMLFAFMRLLRRILTTAAITLGVIALGAFWVAPVALSFDAARKASPVVRVVPTDLKDLSVSQTPGTKLSYVGYEFEIPRSDLDETRTRKTILSWSAWFSALA